jgi:hypothetical protein
LTTENRVRERVAFRPRDKRRRILVADPVQQQIDAYNSRDLEGFLTAYAEDAILEDGEGNVIVQGHDGIRTLYGELFSQSPQLHGEILNRISVGEYVIDEERVTGIEMEGSPSEVHGAVVYRVVEGKIAHVRLLG